MLTQPTICAIIFSQSKTTTVTRLQQTKSKNKQMKDILLQLLAYLLALAQTPKANEEEATKIQSMIKDHQDWINTAAGDSELADPEIADKINDLSIVLGSSEPDPEYAEVPEFDEEGEATEEEETEEAKAEREAQEQADAEAAAEAEEAAKAAAAKPKKILTIKEKREAAARAEQAAQQPAKPKSGLKKK